MSEIPNLGLYREVADSYHGWHANLGDELRENPSFESDLIDKVLLEDVAPKQIIATTGEFYRLMVAAGISVDDTVVREFSAHIRGSLPATHSQTLERVAIEPVRIMPLGPSIGDRLKGTKPRKRKVLKIASCPEANAERKAARAAGREFCGLKLDPANVWMLPEETDGIMIGRGRSRAELEILEAAESILKSGETRHGKLPEFTELGPVRSI